MLKLVRKKPNNLNFSSTLPTFLRVTEYLPTALKSIIWCTSEQGLYFNLTVSVLGSKKIEKLLNQAGRTINERHFRALQENIPWRRGRLEIHCYTTVPSCSHISYLVKRLCLKFFLSFSLYNCCTVASLVLPLNKVYIWISFLSNI